MLAQDVLALLQLSFIASRATGYPRRLATLLLAALSLMLGVCIVLRLAGVASLYEANVVIIPLFVIGVFFAALALAVEARESRERMAVRCDPGRDPVHDRIARGRGCRSCSAG